MVFDEGMRRPRHEAHTGRWGRWPLNVVCAGSGAMIIAATAMMASDNAPRRSLLIFVRSRQE